MMRLAAAHIFSPHQAIIIMTLMSAGVLAAAYWFEYFGGLQPCTMCYWQRIPHVVVIGIGVVTFWLGDRYGRGFLILAVLVMLISAGLGFWHAGVELGFLTGPQGCSGNISFSGDTSAILDTLLVTKSVRCDEVPWSFIGVSMAGWNMIISLVMSAYAWLSLAISR